MSSLGFQTVYRLFNDLDDVVCERVFLPPKQELQAQLASGAPLVTLESQTPVGDFDVLAFSVSFEWDYTNVVTMLRLAGLPPRAAARDARHPLVVIGGAVTFVNPEPLALFADVIAAGEGEMLIRISLSLRLREAAGPRCDVLDALAARPRVLHSVVLRRASTRRRHRSRRYEPRPGSRRAAGREEGGGEERRIASIRQHVDLHARHRVRLPLSDRGGARLRESVPVLLGRLQLPAGARVSHRSHSGACGRRRGGIRAAPGWCRLRSAITRRSSASCAACIDMGYSISPASLRLDDLTDPIVGLLRRERRAVDHHRAGDRVRSAAPRHQQDRDERRDSRRRGASSSRNGIENLKLYFMIGLPTETDDDLVAIRDLTAADPRNHDEACPAPRPHRSHRRQRESAYPEAGHGVSVDADGATRRSPTARGSGCGSCWPASTTCTSTSSRSGIRITRRCCRSVIVASRRRSRLPSATAGNWRAAVAETGVDADFYIFRDRSSGCRAALGHHRRRHEGVVLPRGVREGPARGVDPATEAAQREREIPPGAVDCGLRPGAVTDVGCRYLPTAISPRTPRTPAA